MDLKDRVIDIFKFILCSIGLWKHYDKAYERQKQNQTTKYIVENPFIKFHGRPNDLLSFRYKNKEIDFKWFNLHENSSESGINFGLKDEDEIFLQLNDERLKAYTSGNLNLFFMKCNEVCKMSLRVKENEKIDDVFDRYINLSGLHPQDINSFTYNGTNIQRCGKTLSELGIKNLETLKVISVSVVGAGGIGMLDFVDVKSGKIKRLDFSADAPKWREVKQGLNIFGVCNNSKCKAFKKEVVHKVGFHKFDLKKEVLNIKCPMCDKIIKAKTCGFLKCEYQFSGITIEGGEQKKFDSNPKETKSDEVEYFDPYANGETEWVELIIYVLPKQKIKFIKT